MKYLTKDLPIEKMPEPAKVYISMSQHIGAPALPVVAVGDKVKKGQLVGEASGALHETFGETARLHEMLLSVAVKRLGMLIEPVVIIVTGLIVGFVYIAFFTAIFAMAGVS